MRRISFKIFSAILSSEFDLDTAKTEYWDGNREACLDKIRVVHKRLGRILRPRKRKRLTKKS